MGHYTLVCYTLDHSLVGHSTTDNTTSHTIIPTELSTFFPLTFWGSNATQTYTETRIQINIYEYKRS